MGVHLTLIEVPYHLGVEGVGPGKGPGAYLADGLAATLDADGHDVAVTRVTRSAPVLDELSAVLDVNAALAGEVRRTLDEGRLPVVLGGDCNVALGVTAGFGGGTVAVLWLDAHGDFNTPETSASGYLDGMPLAMTTGLCFRAEVEGAVGGRRVPETHVLHIGARDIDTDEQRNFDASRVTVVPALELLRQGASTLLWPALQTLRRGQSVNRRPGEPGGLADAYLHLDIDVLAGEYAPAVDFPAPGGLAPEEMREIVRLVGQSLRVRVVSLTGFDPDKDDSAGSTLAAGTDMLRAALAAAEGPQGR
jgi:arginase